MIQQRIRMSQGNPRGADISNSYDSSVLDEMRAMGRSGEAAETAVLQNLKLRGSNKVTPATGMHVSAAAAVIRQPLEPHTVSELNTNELPESARSGNKPTVSHVKEIGLSVSNEHAGSHDNALNRNRPSTFQTHLGEQQSTPMQQLRDPAISGAVQSVRIQNQEAGSSKEGVFSGDFSPSEPDDFHGLKGTLKRPPVGDSDNQPTERVSLGTKRQLD